MFIFGLMCGTLDDLFNTEHNTNSDEMPRIIHTRSILPLLGFGFGVEKACGFSAGSGSAAGGHGGAGPSSWPSPAEEELQDTLSFDEWLLPRKESSFLLPVGSKDMQTAGIVPGDTLVVERGFPAKPDDIVVVDLRGSWKLRRFGQTDKNLSALEKEDFRLVGVVTAVIRKYH